mgnify:CR=1 FL=1
MKTTLPLILLYFASTLFVKAQVPQNVIVEHLANNPAVLHIATHPSSPYSSCVLYQHNPTENNARTNFYSILGGTPRIVINGTVMGSGTSFTSNTLFDTFKVKMSPIQIRVDQQKFGTDSIRATITVKAVSAHAYTTAQLYVPLVEDSLNYSAPNGEKLHHNVFRKSFSNGSIQVLVVGDSTVYSYTLAGNADWNFDQLKAMAFLQNDVNKSMIQAAEYSSAKTNNPTSVKASKQIAWSIYPNPAQKTINIQSNINGQLTVMDPNGKEIVRSIFQSYATLNTSKWSKGIYFISLSTDESTVYKRVVKN